MPITACRVSSTFDLFITKSWILDTTTTTAAMLTPASNTLGVVSIPPRDPLHILFCGTDDFSCVSLQALYDEMQSPRSSIASVQVLVRPAKPTGRGLKAIVYSPVKELAQRLGLQVHERDTFTGWSPVDIETNKINMVVAVSFGLFVPPRILRSCKYGGLNVHPSLLPDLHGASPIEHAILLGRQSTGVTVQTLHEKTFDGGRRLLAAPSSDSVSCVSIDTEVFTVDRRTTAKKLRERLAPVGARLLVEVIQRGLFLPLPRTGADEQEASSEGAPAPKLSKADREIQFTSTYTTATAVDRQMRALGPVWTHVVGMKKKKQVRKRLILEEMELAALPLLDKAMENTDTEMDTLTFQHGGRDVVLPVVVDGTDLLLPLGGPEGTDNNPNALRLRQVKIEGFQTSPAATALGSFVQKQPASCVSWDVVTRAADK
ncbi:methionyl-trna formyltransferase [Ophiostoma piceae UAMH 11346]|uniref:methionyl-tRNA formyltransferase n=1 Tax=Ophiostoma piceae (strain UAMH 11346) TaxID=1262450 RepID=S3BZM0_OPHP1|nr:methionyl-trna formyltransferase [Ophiostoma piceae UAMH 11346]